MKCHECGEAELVGAEKPHHYLECGLDNVTLVGIVVDSCPRCGATFPKIPAMAALHRGIASLLVHKPEALSSKEIGFLRRSIGWSSEDLASYMHVDIRTVKRWENSEAPQSMGKTAEVLLRSAVAQDMQIAEYTPGLIRSLPLDTPSVPWRLRMRRAASRGWARDAA